MRLWEIGMSDGQIIKAKRHWEAVVDTLPQLICLVDANGRITRCNRTFEHWGLGDVHNVVGGDFHQRLHPSCDDPECYLKQHVDMARMASLATPSRVFRVYDEQLSRYLKIKLSSMHHSGSKMGSENKYALFVAEDVTSRVGVARKASASEEKLQLLVESVSDLIVQHTTGGTMHYVSPASAALLGREPHEMLGLNLYEAIHKGDRDSVAEAMKQIAMGETVEGLAFRISNADGYYRWVESRSHSIVNAAGTGELVSIMRDISSRRREDELALEYSKKLELEVARKTGQLTMVIDMLKQQIDENEQDRIELEMLGRRYTSLVENTLTGIYLRQKNRIVFCNERFANIFGYAREEIAGMELCQLLVSGEDDTDMLDVESDVHATMSRANVVEGRRRDGSRIWIKMSRARLENEEGVFVLGNLIDVTEQVRVQDELRKSEQALHQLSSLLIVAQENERKRIANELHDGIGQRLSAIKFSVENVLRECDSIKNNYQSTRLQDVVEKIRDTIEEVRRTSMDLRPSILDDLGLMATINWYCREFDAMFPAIELVKEVDAQEKQIRDELKVVIFRIMQEALHNITKHAAARRVEISLCMAGEGLTLRISDNGRGFVLDAEVLNGPSLGLKSMRERAELMGGCFELWTAAGEGTQISVNWANPGPLSQLDETVLDRVGSDL
jgi:PAS domain S-box-containing protein